MTKSFCWCLLLSGVLAVAGCGQQSQVETVSLDNVPLSIEEWRQMSPNEKFDLPAIERLKLGDPKLKTTKGWNHFLKTEMKDALVQSSVRAQN